MALRGEQTCQTSQCSVNGERAPTTRCPTPKQHQEHQEPPESHRTCSQSFRSGRTAHRHRRPRRRECTLRGEKRKEGADHSVICGPEIPLSNIESDTFDMALAHIYSRAPRVRLDNDELLKASAKRRVRWVPYKGPCRYVCYFGVLSTSF